MDVLSLPNSVRQSLDGSDSHIFVKGLPPRIDEASLYEIFSKFGDIQSCRLVPSSSPTNQAVVNLSSPLQAKEAISALNGAPTDRGVLEVVAGSAATNGGRPQAPCDNVYIRQMPATWTEQDLKDLFSPFGVVQECRILHRGDDIRGAGALVRMNNVAAASQAILALHGQFPTLQSGELSSIPLLVRYADSPEEKARKQARKEQMAGRQHRSLDIAILHPRNEDIQAKNAFRHSSLPAAFHAMGPTGQLDLGVNPVPSCTPMFSGALNTEANIDALLGSFGPSTSLNVEPLAAPALNGLNAVNGYSTANKGLMHAPPPPPPPSTTCASLYVKNLPPETDRLWLYERFAPHGAILSVKVLQEENTTRCRGVGFVNYTDAQGALNAIHNVNGLKVADKHLHVSLQTARGRS